MIRRPPRSTLDRSSAASDVYKRQLSELLDVNAVLIADGATGTNYMDMGLGPGDPPEPVSYTHLRAHETVLDLVCRLLLEKKKKNTENIVC